MIRGQSHKPGVPVSMEIDWQYPVNNLFRFVKGRIVTNFSVFGIFGSSRIPLFFLKTFKIYIDIQFKSNYI